MSTISINLGTADRLTVLYSYPNFTGDKKSLADTISHWFGQTLIRDGCVGASASVRIDGTGNYFLDLTGPDNLAASFAGYAKRLPQFLANGWNAWTNVVPMLQKTGKWDPCPDKPASSYLPWRFFLPHGMPMLNQKALLFFHYPPIRLLETNQDYLDDPVPVRCEELLAANGVTSLPGNLASGDIMLFNTVMDATPIGAEDDQGSKNPQQCAADGCPASAYDPDYGLIPIQYFPDYQKAQVSLLLNPSPKSGYTAPIVIYGAHPLATFNKLYGTSLKVYQTTVVTGILPGLKTPVLASSHPYVFYGQAQGFDNIGSGIMPPANVPAATAQMIKDLAVARWLKALTDDPSQPVADVWAAAQKFWNDPAQTSTVSNLVQHQGSLWYYNLPALDFKFKVPLSSATITAAKPVATPMKTTAASVKSTTGLQVIGDNGTPVDWWFIYKISGVAQTTSSTPATGKEFVYFDSDMAAAGKTPVLSKNLIDQSGALFDTFSQLFTADAKTNKDLGYYCYNDEDRYKPGTKSGIGPTTPCGHCKGALAFDLASDSAFWLIHSVPLLPMNADFIYPGTGLKMAQTMLCIQLQNAAASQPIAQLMFDAHGPNVPVASDLLKVAHDPSNNFSAPWSNVLAKLGAADPRVKLMQNQNGSSGSKPAPYQGQVPFVSKGGQKFLAIAKNRAWGDPKYGQAPEDFYNILVSSALNENIEVETWENAGKNNVAIPASSEAGETHPIENMHAVDFGQIGIPYSWGEPVDHAKLAISDRSNAAGTDRWVCVGDINYTLSMEKRGGGTVAFICEPLWNALVKVLLPTPNTKSIGSPAKKTVTKPSPAKATAPAPAAAQRVTAVKPAPKQAAAAKPIAKKAVKTKAPLKKAASKKAAQKKTAKKSASKKAAPAKKAAKSKGISKKAASAKKTTKAKVILKRTKKEAPAKKASPKKVVSKKKAPRKTAPKKPAAKAVKKKTAKKAGKKR